MSLRELLGLPPKSPRSAPSGTTDGGDPAVYDAAKAKADQVAGHPGLALLSEAQRTAFANARSEASGLAAHGQFSAAAKRLSDAVAAAAQQISKAQTSAKDLRDVAGKVGGVLDAAQLMGVPADHVKALRDRHQAILAAGRADAVAAAADMATLARDIARDPVILSAKAARDKILKERPAVDAAGEAALKVAEETPTVQKQRRILADALQKMAGAAGKLDFEGAARHLETCKAATTAIEAEAPKIAAAVALRDEVMRKRKAIDGDVKAARQIYGTDPEAESLVAQFASADQNFEGAMHRKDYAIAQTFLGSLEALAKRVVATKPAMDKAEADRAAHDAEVREMQNVYAAIKAVPLATADLKRLFEATDGRIDAYFDASNTGKADAASQIAGEVRALHAEFKQAASAAAAELERHKTALAEYDKSCRKRVERYLGLKPETFALPEMKEAQAEAIAARDEVVRSETAMDFTAFAAAVDALKAKLDVLTRLEPEDLAAIKRRNEIFLAEKEHATLFQAALDVTPYSDEMLALHAAHKSKLGEMQALRIAGDEAALTKLPGVVAAAKAVLDRAHADAENAADAEKAAAKARDALIPEHRKAKATATKYTPDSTPELNELNAAVKRFNWQFKSGRWMEAIATTRDFTPIFEKIAAKEPIWRAASEAKKEETEKRYAKAKADYDTVIAFDPVLPDIEAEIKAVEDQHALVDAAMKADEFGKAEGLLATLEAKVGDLLKKKPAHDAAVADKAWIDAKAQALKADVKATTKQYALIPETLDIQKRAIFEKESAKATYDRRDFAKARGHWTELERLTVAWKAKEADNDAGATPEFEALDTRLDSFWSEVDIANEITGITPELKALEKAYDASSDRFWKAFKALDWALATELVDDFEAATRALAAKKSDYDAALVAAKQRTATATAEIDATDLADLKTKPAAEQLDLLDGMRASGEKLTDAQRKLQRKIYNAMSYDEDFKREDTRRREELIDALRADKEVTGARADWAKDTTTDEQRLAVLMKVLAAECRVFGIPMPAVRLYRKPKGCGFFSPNTMTLNLNTHPASGWLDYREAVDTVVHENIHNYQAVLVQRLEEGILTPEDPEYVQAQIFAANNHPGGYVGSGEKPDPDEAEKNPYKTQPVEMHAWENGDKVAKGLIASDKKPPKGVVL